MSDTNIGAPATEAASASIPSFCWEKAAAQAAAFSFVILLVLENHLYIFSKYYSPTKSSYNEIN